MYSRTLRALASASIFLLSALAVQAQEVLTSVTRDQLATILKDNGYRAEVVPSPSSPNGAYIRTGIGGRTVLVGFFNCAAEKCGAIQFWTGFAKSPKYTTALVEKWNSEIRYAKTHLTAEGSLHIEYDIYVAGGISSEYIKAATLLYTRLLSQLDDYVKAAPLPIETDVTITGSRIEALAKQGKFTEAIAALDETAAVLWERAPLTFRRFLWVATQPDGFGSYQSRENNVYASGAEMFVYSEPVGIGWRQSGDVYQTNLAIDIVVKDKNGAELMRRSDFGVMNVASRVRNREFMARFTYKFTGIPAGEYVLDTTMRDKVNGKTGTFSLPFVVR